MKENQINHEDFLKLLVNAQQKGEQSSTITTKEMVEDLILQMKKLYTA
ncbi:hypothetical protein RFW18_14025 [Metabacillus idriensis]|jgi:hypothetical protein|nr:MULTISPECIES: hypothetical protein [Bacillaceae]MDQ0857131.1 hypothetical protein [Bacillus sp. V2I10]MDR0138869.1 hypothetical protein [Metabacillus idriensis]